MNRLNLGIFGNREFKTNQLEAVTITLADQNLLLCLPTGGGKSLCFQLPGIIDGGLTIIISPLLALIHDQVKTLRRLGLEARGISSRSTYQEFSEVVTLMKQAESPLRFLYITPERLHRSPRFLEVLREQYRKGNVSRFVIDEAHCISE